MYIGWRTIVNINTVYYCCYYFNEFLDLIKKTYVAYNATYLYVRVTWGGIKRRSQSASVI